MKIILLLWILQIVGSGVFGQVRTSQFDYKITYAMTYRTDSLSQDTKVMDMVLFVKNDVSMFTSLRRYNRDSILYNHERVEAEKMSLPGALALSLVDKENCLIFRDHAKISTYDQPFGSRDFTGKCQVYRYQEDVSSMTWDIVDEMDSIGGFLCQKALLSYGGRKWTAYFAIDIPIHEGPYKFCGLPGLIVKIEDEKASWRFEMVSLQQHPVTIVSNFQKWFVFHDVSKSLFFKERKLFQNNLPMTMKSAGVNIPEAAMLRYSERLKKDNNWIELYP